MKASTLLGIILGSVAIFGAFIWEGGSFDSLIMLPAMLIVFGGTLAAGLAGTSMSTMARIPRLLKIAFFPKKFELDGIILQIVEFSAIARRQGILALEAKLKEVQHPFLRKLFQVAIDGADPESIQKVAENEISYITERHNTNIGLFVKLGGFSPTMGIIGTVMGLISTLAAAGSEPNVLIHHIASAFIATMWGIFMANIVWLPIGDKLRTLHNEEIQLLQIIVEGVYSVQLGEVPSVIRAKLVGAFPLSRQAEILEEHKKIQARIFATKPQPTPEKMSAAAAIKTAIQSENSNQTVVKTGS
jgi:chemotaxis protein MotA